MLIRRVRQRLQRLWWAWRGNMRLDAHGVGHIEAVFYGLPIIQRTPGSTIVLGKRVVLCSHPEFTALGVSRPVILRTLDANASIVVGDDVGMSGTVVCAATSVSIGSGTLLGADVIIADTDFHPVDLTSRRYAKTPAGSPADAVTIERDVFIGARSVILKGVSIGAGSVVGANSVVTQNLPAGVVAAGNPCRVLRPLADARD